MRSGKEESSMLVLEERRPFSFFVYMYIDTVVDAEEKDEASNGVLIWSPMYSRRNNLCIY